MLLHQVLHYAPEPERALAEAARVLRDGGRIAIVDFAAHTREELRERFQHVRLGFADSQMRDLLRQAGFVPTQPVTLEGNQLEVKVWLGRQSSRSPAKRSKDDAR